MTAPLTADEQRILERFGSVTICRCAGWPAEIDPDTFGAPTRSGSMDWPGLEPGAYPSYHSRRHGIVVACRADYDLATGKIHRPLFTLTYRRIQEWARTVPADLAARARGISHGYYDHAACEELAELLLAPAPAEALEEMTLW